VPGDRVERGTRRLLVGVERAVLVADRDTVELLRIENAEIAREGCGRVRDDAVQRFVEGAGGREQEIAQRADHLELVGEPLRRIDFAHAVGDVGRDLEQRCVGRVDLPVDRGAEDDEHVLAQRDERDRAGVVRPEYVPQIRKRAPRHPARVERSGEERLLGDADLDDAGPARAAARSADVRKAPVADATEEKEIGRAPRSGELLD
jgi:hypothetical protein